MSAEFRCARVLRGDAEQTAQGLGGRRIRGIKRHGKFLVMELDSGQCFVAHLGMTGRFLLDGTPGRHTQAILTLDRGQLLFDDIRRFGRLELSAALPERVENLGPEPLEVSFADFLGRLKARKSRLKSLLLNQRFLRGLGNIYADEALFRAGAHPLAIGSHLRAARARRLYDSIREVLMEAIESRGSSVTNYVDAEGRKGSFQFRHNVYRRTGIPCPRCGTKIRRIIVGQRSTHFCPKCQKLR